MSHSGERAEITVSFSEPSLSSGVNQTYGTLTIQIPGFSITEVSQAMRCIVKRVMLLRSLEFGPPLLFIRGDDQFIEEENGKVMDSWRLQMHIDGDNERTLRDLDLLHFDGDKLVRKITYNRIEMPKHRRIVEFD